MQNKNDRAFLLRPQGLRITLAQQQEQRCLTLRSPHPEFRLFSNNHSKYRNLICVGRIHFHGQSLFIYMNEEAAEEKGVEEEKKEN